VGNPIVVEDRRERPAHAALGEVGAHTMLPKEVADPRGRDSAAGRPADGLPVEVRKLGRPAVVADEEKALGKPPSRENRKPNQATVPARDRGDEMTDQHFAGFRGSFADSLDDPADGGHRFVLEVDPGRRDLAGFERDGAVEVTQAPVPKRQLHGA
jgi:hypothetical protein